MGIEQQWTGEDGDGRPVDLRKCPCCERPRLMWTLRDMGKKPWTTHPEEWQAAYKEEGTCCNPKCNGRWGTGCWHCHSPRYSSAEAIAESRTGCAALDEKPMTRTEMWGREVKAQAAQAGFRLDALGNRVRIQIGKDAAVRVISRFRFVELTWAGGEFEAMNLFTASEARELMASLGRAADEAERFERASEEEND